MGSGGPLGGKVRAGSFGPNQPNGTLREAAQGNQTPPGTVEDEELITHQGRGSGLRARAGVLLKVDCAKRRPKPGRAERSEEPGVWPRRHRQGLGPSSSVEQR